MGRRRLPAARAAPGPAAASRPRSRSSASRTTSSAPRSRCSTRPAAAARSAACAGDAMGPPAARRARPRPPRGRHRRHRRRAGRTPASRCWSSPPTPRCARGSSRRSSAGCALCSHAALRARPAPGDGAHVVVIDPPATPAAAIDLLAGEPAGRSIWPGGATNYEWAAQLHEREHGLRATLSEVYRALRALETAEGEALEAALRGDSASAPVRSGGRERAAGPGGARPRGPRPGDASDHGAGRPAHIAGRVGVATAPSRSYWTRDDDG